MTKQEKIIHYLAENGLDIRKYIHFDYERSGTIVIRSGNMFGYGGRYEDWKSLLQILDITGCPVRIHRIRGKNHTCGYKYLLSYDRLVWHEKED